MSYKKFCTEDKELRKEVYEEHIKDKELARKETQFDKEKALDNSKISYAVFDFQKVLQISVLEVRIFYCKRKLSTSNFTIYDMATRDMV
jgi:hypothetical protein